MYDMCVYVHICEKCVYIRIFVCVSSLYRYHVMSTWHSFLCLSTKMYTIMFVSDYACMQTYVKHVWSSKSIQVRVQMPAYRYQLHRRAASPYMCTYSGRMRRPLMHACAFSGGKKYHVRHANTHTDAHTQACTHTHNQ